MLLKNTKYQILTPSGFKDFAGIKKTTSSVLAKVEINGQTVIGSISHILKVGDQKIALHELNPTLITGKDPFDLYSIVGVEGEEYVIENDLISLNCAYIKEKLFEEFYSSVYPTISSGKESKIIITSSAKDINHFYELWKDANDQKNSYAPIEIHWTDVPGRDEFWKNKVVADIGKKRFDREFGNEFFGRTSVVIPIPLLKTLTCFHPLTEKDEIKIFELPEKTASYVAITDIAEGRGEGDYSTLVIIKMPTKETDEPYKVVFTLRSNELDLYSFIETVFLFLTKYNEALLIPEINIHDIAQPLYRDYEYINIIKTTLRNQKIATAFTSEKTKLGIKTTLPIKKIGMESLIQLFEQQKLIISDVTILKELSNLVRGKESFEARTGYHDDLVICLVLFAWAIRENGLKEQLELENDIFKTLKEEHLKTIQDELPSFFIDRGE